MMMPKAEIHVAYLTWIREVMRSGLQAGGEGKARRFLTYSHVAPDGRLVARHVRAGSDPERFGRTDPWGNQDLVMRIAERYRVSTDRVLVTSGASQGFTVLCQTFLSPGDHVVIEDPVYEPLFAVPRFLGMKLSKIPRRPENGYRFDPKEVAKAVSSRTVLVVVTNLHNPTGALLEPQDLQDLLRQVRKRSKKALVCVDEVYHDFSGGGRPSAAILDEECVSLNSVSKVFGLGFLRIGWIVSTPSRCLDLRRMMSLLENTGAPVAESIADEVFAHSELYDAHWTKVLARNRPEVKKWIEPLVAEGYIKGHVPEQGCIHFPAVIGMSDTREFARQLAIRHKVYVVPGIFFGSSKSLRIGFGGRFDDVRSGMEILAETIRAVKKTKSG